MNPELNIRKSGGTQNLPARYFKDDGIYEAEWGKIFSNRWLCVGRESKIGETGEFTQRVIEGENILLVRGRERKLRAFYNHCRHRGTKLCEEASGRLKENIQCPYHAWTYSLDGRLTGAPNMADVEGFSKTDYPLQQVALETWEGFVFINFAENPEPFQKAFAPIMEKFLDWHLPELQVAHRKTYNIRANWKLLFQNYSECYHCPTVHPLLNQITPYKDSSNDFEEGPFLGGPMFIKPIGGSLTMNGQACAPTLVSGENKQRVYFYTLFPNLFLSLHPDYVLTHRLERQSTGVTNIHCDWLFHPDALAHPDFRLEQAVEFWDMTNGQDWRVCELTQAGLRSRVAAPGPYANLESMLAAFDQEYLRVMEE